MSDVRVVLCTFPSTDVARQIGTLLVEMQLAACVNLVPAVESVYRWKDRVETASEVLAIIKTTAAGLPALEKELATRHPYEVAEIIAIDPTHISGPYARWLADSIRP